MAATPGKKPKQSVSEAIARARAAATPRIEQATAAAGPKAEKAAQAAGSFLGTLRERAKETAKQFSEGYGNADADGPGTPAAQREAGGERSATAPPATAPPETATPETATPGPDERPRPRPRPGPSRD